MTITLLKGNDESLLSKAVTEKVSELVGSGDAGLMVEELSEEQYRLEDDSFELLRIVESAMTPPFLTEKRVVVCRHLGRFSKAAAITPLVDYLASPIETTDLVLVWEKGINPRQDRLSPPPKALLQAIDGAGGSVLETAVPSGKKAGLWLDSKLAESSLSFDRQASRKIAEHLGEQRSRVTELIETLESVFGPGSAIDLAAVEPFLGQTGDVPPWDLTDAIDRGDVSLALRQLQRMHQGGGRHPLQIMAILQTHYLRMFHLDGAPVEGEKQAAQLLGLKGSTFPAKKALGQTRKLGSAKIRKAIGLLGEADIGLRGDSGWPSELVVEVLVARLASMAAR